MVVMAKAEYERTLREARSQAEHGSEEGGEVHEADDTKELRNQFKYSERAAQTVNNPMRDRETMTEPPPVNTVEGHCSLSLIYDAYVEDQERQRKMDALSSKGKKPGQKILTGEAEPEAADEKPSTATAGKDSGDAVHSKEMSMATYLMERMVNQNMYSDIADDFRYWEDMTDQYR